MTQTLTARQVKEYFELGKQIKELEDKRKKISTAMKSVYNNVPGAYNKGAYVVKLIQQDRSKMDPDLEVQFVLRAKAAYAQKLIDDESESLRKDPATIEWANNEAEKIFGPAVKTVLTPDESVIENLVFTGMIIASELAEECLIENKIMTVRVDPMKAAE